MEYKNSWVRLGAGMAHSVSHLQPRCPRKDIAVTSLNERRLQCIGAVWLFLQACYNMVNFRQRRIRLWRKISQDSWWPKGFNFHLKNECPPRNCVARRPALIRVKRGRFIGNRAAHKWAHYTLTFLSFIFFPNNLLATSLNPRLTSVTSKTLLPPLDSLRFISGCRFK